MRITVRKHGKYISTRVFEEQTVVESGLLDRSEQWELHQELMDAANEVAMHIKEHDPEIS